MPLQVTENVYVSIKGLAAQHQLAADQHRDQRDAAEAGRVIHQGYADDYEVLLADLQVQPAELAEPPVTAED